MHHPEATIITGTLNFKDPYWKSKTTNAYGMSLHIFVGREASTYFHYDDMLLTFLKFH